jgi:hypothetical protein
VASPVAPRQPEPRPRDGARVVRKAIVGVLRDEPSGLRLKTLRERVEHQFGEALSKVRFKNYVNELSRGRHPVLERLGYGRYRLR